MTKRSWLPDRYVSRERLRCRGVSLQHYFTHSLPDYLRRRLAPQLSPLTFSPIEPENSLVWTRQSNGIIPHPSRLLARLICADLQALGDKSARVEAWSRVRV